MRTQPRVLHIGNTANVAANLRDALESERLAQALVFETHNNRLGYNEDIRFSWDWSSTGRGRAGRYLSHALLMMSLIEEADIVQVHHSGNFALAAQKWARVRGKRVIRHFHGVELRLGDVSGEIRNADAVFVSTPDLRPTSRLGTPGRGLPGFPIRILFRRRP